MKWIFALEPSSTNLPKQPRTKHAHTHLRTHSPSLSLSLSLSLSRTHTHTHTHTLTHTYMEHTRAQTLALIHTHTLHITHNCSYDQRLWVVSSTPYHNCKPARPHHLPRQRNPQLQGKVLSQQRHQVAKHRHMHRVKIGAAGRRAREAVVAENVVRLWRRRCMRGRAWCLRLCAACCYAWQPYLQTR